MGWTGGSVNENNLTYLRGEYTQKCQQNFEMDAKKDDAKGKKSPNECRI